MEIIRAYKVEIDPNNCQRTLLLRHAGAARFAWNWGLARRIAEYQETKSLSNSIEQHRQLNALKKTEFPWMYEVSKCAPQEALRNLDKAYQNFFRRIRNGEKPGFPRFKSRRRGIGSFTLTGSIKVSKQHIQLPRFGKLRLKERGYIPSDGIHILSATCSERAGRWFVSIQCETVIPDPVPGTGPVLGIDLGVKDSAVCSDGRRFANPKALRKNLKILARAQRTFSRRKKGSNKRAKAKARVARIHYRIANIRRDHLHKFSTVILSAKPKPQAIVVEDLNVKGMARNHRLALAISDASMAELRTMLEYKAAWSGIEVVVADRFFASSKMCHVCGCLNKSLSLSDRTWRCECGEEHDRDLNAAINLSKYRQFGGNSRPQRASRARGSGNLANIIS